MDGTERNENSTSASSLDNDPKGKVGAWSPSSSTLPVEPRFRPHRVPFETNIPYQSKDGIKKSIQTLYSAVTIPTSD